MGAEPARDALSAAPETGWDAELVWKVWRRILREPALHQSLLAPGFAGRAAAHGLTPIEARIAAEYGARGRMLGWAVETYRFRLERAVLFALGTGAPLTLRLLEAYGCDLRELARRYLVSTDFRDDGPNVYRACADILDFVERSVTDPPPELADTLALERAAVSLTRDLALAPESLWPRGAEHAEPSADTRYVQSGTARPVSTSHAISAWLVSPERVAPGQAERVAEHFLVYVPTPESDLDIAEISTSARQLFERLAAPCSLEEAAGGIEADDDELVAALEAFVSMGVVREEPLP